METSQAIQPGVRTSVGEKRYKDVGCLKSFSRSEDEVHFTCECANISVKFYRPDIARITMHPGRRPDRASSIALSMTPQQTAVDVRDEPDQITVASDRLKLQFHKNPFRLCVYDGHNRLLVKEADKGMAYTEQGDVICFKQMEETDHFYGFGEKTGFLNKRGEKYTMWNSDVYAPHNPEIDALYQSIPYFMTLREGRAHGIFMDNTFKTVFDMKSKKDTYSFMAEGGQLDYYVLAGPTPQEVVKQYTALTGRMQLPPKWALGYHQSRYSYQSEQEVRELVRTFREKEIPVDAVHLDIHYMNGYRVFTFDREAFPDPAALAADLKEAGVRLVPIVDPGVKEDPEYGVYHEGIHMDMFCRYLEGNLFYGDVWPGRSAFPDFTDEKAREWWGEKHRFYTDLGIEGIWNDMNEPAVFNETKTIDVKVMHRNGGEPKTHRELHNVYGILMGRATYEGMEKLLDGRRPFLLTRAGFAGIQRYAAVWTGDNRSFWEHLSMAMPMCMNLGLSGVAFCGPDTGGFAHDCSGELLIRWTQLGAFTPYFRNHSALDSVRQEPWAFGGEVERIVKKYIRLRYRWLPYLYTLFAEASETGLPVMRPLLMEYPEDPHTYNLSDQFLCGKHVLIAPITRPGDTHRSVYLPSGRWYDYWTDRMYSGGQYILVNAPLDTLPIFIKEGAAVAHGEERLYTEAPEQVRDVHIYAMEKGESHYTLYEDDGRTFAYRNHEYLKKDIRCVFDGDSIQLYTEDRVQGYTPDWKTCRVVLHGISGHTSVWMNNQRVSAENIRSDKHTLTVTIP